MNNDNQNIPSQIEKEDTSSHIQIQRNTSETNQEPGTEQSKPQRSNRLLYSKLKRGWGFYIACLQGLLLIGAILDLVSNLLGLVSAAPLWVSKLIFLISVIILFCSIFVWKRGVPCISDDGKPTRWRGSNLQLFPLPFVLLAVSSFGLAIKLKKAPLLMNITGRVCYKNSNPCEPVGRVKLVLDKTGEWTETQDDGSFVLLNVDGRYPNAKFKYEHTDYPIVLNDNQEYAIINPPHIAFINGPYPISSHWHKVINDSLQLSAKDIHVYRLQAILKCPSKFSSLHIQTQCTEPVEILDSYVDSPIDSIRISHTLRNKNTALHWRYDNNKTQTKRIKPVRLLMRIWLRSRDGKIDSSKLSTQYWFEI